MKYISWRTWHDDFGSTQKVYQQAVPNSNPGGGAGPDKRIARQAAAKRLEALAKSLSEETKVAKQRSVDQNKSNAQKRVKEATQSRQQELLDSHARAQRLQELANSLSTKKQNAAMREERRRNLKPGESLIDPLVEKPKKEGNEAIDRWKRHLAEEAVDLKDFVVDTWTGSGDNLAESTQPILDALTPENIETSVGKVQLVLGDAGVAVKDGTVGTFEAVKGGLAAAGIGIYDYFSKKEPVTEKGLNAQSILVTGESNWKKAGLGLLGKIGLDLSPNSEVLTGPEKAKQKKVDLEQNEWANKIGQNEVTKRVLGTGSEIVKHISRGTGPIDVHHSNVFFEKKGALWGHMAEGGTMELVPAALFQKKGISSDVASIAKALIRNAENMQNRADVMILATKSMIDEDIKWGAEKVFTRSGNNKVKAAADLLNPTVFDTEGVRAGLSAEMAYETVRLCRSELHRQHILISAARKRLERDFLDLAIDWFPGTESDKDFEKDGDPFVVKNGGISVKKEGSVFKAGVLSAQDVRALGFTPEEAAMLLNEHSLKLYEETEIFD